MQGVFKKEYKPKPEFAWHFWNFTEYRTSFCENMLKVPYVRSNQMIELEDSKLLKVVKTSDFTPKSELTSNSYKNQKPIQVCLRSMTLLVLNSVQL